MPKVGLIVPVDEQPPNTRCSRPLLRSGGSASRASRVGHEARLSCQLRSGG